MVERPGARYSLTWGVCGRGRSNVRSAAGDEFATAQAQSVRIGTDYVGKFADAVLP
jgi:hypothetical protein